MSVLKDRIAVVTGASRGIGYHAALAYAKAGAHVIAVARTIGGLEELDDEIKANGSDCTLVPLNLTDFDAIDRLGASIHERWGRLDILLANAGMLGGLSPMGHITPKIFERVMAINVTANFRLLRSFDPLFKQSDAARVIMMSSGSPHSCKPFWGAYATSKAAVEAMARVYANENANSSINCNIFNPGATRTGMRAEAMPGEDPQSIPHPSELADQLIMLACADCAENGKIFSANENKFLQPRSPA